MQDEQPTCGKGLAANAVLPEKLGALMEAMAELLQNHTRSLDSDEANGRLERDAYEHLVREQRAIASSLERLAVAMRSYRDLPVAAHDHGALADRKSLDVFDRFIRAEESVLDLLKETTGEHRAMLGHHGR